jgi:integrase
MPKKKKGPTAPKLVNGRGNIPINRTYAGFGTIRVSSGTRDEHTYSRLIHMLDDLHNIGNLGTLRSIQNRKLTPLEAYDTLKNKGIGTVLVGDQDKPIVHAIDEWLELHPVKANTKRGYKSHLQGFYKKVGQARTVRELPAVFESYRKVCLREGIARSFNQVRAVLLAYAKTEFKPTSVIYQETKAVQPLPVTPKIFNDAVSVAHIVKLTDGLEQPFRDIIWSLCHSGMRSGEYFQRDGHSWEETHDRLIVRKSLPGHGNKGPAKREVILPFPLSSPTRAEVTLKRAIDKRLEALGPNFPNITPHTFRKCFTHWCAEAGIPRARREAYSGRKTQTVSDIYERHEVDSFLKDDGKRFAAYVKKHRPPKVESNPIHDQFYSWPEE